MPAHFAAVSTNAQAMDAFGVNPNYRFMMWDWVGGAIRCGRPSACRWRSPSARRFPEFLAGAHEMDEHFRSAPWERNLPVLMGLMGVWNINFLDLPTLAVLPYDGRLRRFPAYCSSSTWRATASRWASTARPWRSTAPVIWGEPGNNAQHSFFQMLHQGTPRAALDFLLPALSSAATRPQAELAIANCLAQAEAFAFGYTIRAGDEKSSPRARSRPDASNFSHAQGPCGRPSGEHRASSDSTRARWVGWSRCTSTRCSPRASLWGINAFDQWGVELGKKMCEEVFPLVRDPEIVVGRPRTCSSR